ncbi:MAG: hypothetical protein MJY95_08220 [Bacteroidaceae bacterium]|nr:hypothetical protein [Bacteroidaceae bacterium]
METGYTVYAVYVNIEGTLVIDGERGRFTYPGVHGEQETWDAILRYMEGK